MTCRAPTASTTCTGSSPTGAGLTYDNEGQLVGWTSALNGTPTPNTAAFAHDGEGSRVALKTTTATGITTTTDYLLGGLEEQQTVGGSVHPSSTLTEYYPLPGIGTAVRVNTSSASTLSYLAGDQLGSVSVALSTSGTVTAQALYSPYGTVRYSSGTLPTAHGYTGQLADAMTGLDYYGARYYDPSLGEFTSADTEIEGGLDRYAYVGDSPCTYNDPSGHCRMPRRASVDAFIAALGLIIQFAKYLIPGLGGIPAPPGGGATTPPTAVVAPAPPNTTSNTPITPGDDPTAIDYGNGNYGGENDNNPTADVLQDIANNSNGRPCGGPEPKQKPSRWYDVRRRVRAPNGRPLGRYQPVGEPLPISYPLPVAAPLPAPAPASPPWQPLPVAGTPPAWVLRPFVPDPGTSSVTSPSGPSSVTLPPGWEITWHLAEVTAAILLVNYALEQLYAPAPVVASWAARNAYNASGGDTGQGGGGGDDLSGGRQDL